MSDTALSPVARPVPIPVGKILPWAVFAGLVCLLAIYFVGAEEGATALTHAEDLPLLREGKASVPAETSPLLGLAMSPQHAECDG